MPEPAAGRGELGPCPVCGRPMLAGPSVDRHHFLPKSRGGRAREHVHRICHRKIHSLLTEVEFERDFADPERLRAHPEIARFVRWLSGKPPEFWAPTATSNSKARGRR
ncbi:HNH endonuclease family protein [Marinimicrococcus flavescens]|uniref:HNH endonuclease n=1 Tax=Marinimicrococcus flavescens TaxID=3031815 RepID=A0AAP3UX90_9PROT|nr:HNH endonuclease [Marinimicrococcus flavescens]